MPFRVDVFFFKVRVCVCVSLDKSSVTICYSRVNNHLGVNLHESNEYCYFPQFLRLKGVDHVSFFGELLFVFVI